MSEWGGGYRRDDQDYEAPAAETYGESGYGDDDTTGRRPQEASYDGEYGGGGYQKPSYGDNEDGVGGGGFGGYGADQESDAQARLDAIEKTRDEETNYGRAEVGGLLTAAAAGGYALYERHEMEADPENAGRHKLAMEVAAGVAVTGAGVGLYGHHEKEEAEENLDQLEEGPKKKHGWFGGGGDDDTTTTSEEVQPERKSSWF